MKRRLVFLAVNASYAHSGLAAWCLQAAVGDMKWDWHTIETTVKDDPQAILERVRQLHPDVLAATLYLFNRPCVVDLLKRYRALAPACRIIVGGPECLGDNRRLVAAEQVADAAVRGEGEVALRKWLAALDVPSVWPSIPGLCAVVDGHYADAGMAEPVGALDDIPPFYGRMLAGFRKPFVQVETSRGCSNGCLFCTSRHSRVRVKSMDRLRLDLAAVRDAGVPEVRIVDRTFNEQAGRAVALLRLFREEFGAIRFHLEIDPARLTDEMLKELALAPARFHLEAGVQSLGPGVYAAIERAGTVDRTRAGLARLCAIPGLATHVDLIAGLPGGDFSQVLADVRGVMDVQPHEIQLERLKLLPGTPLADRRVEWGIVAAGEPPYQVLQTAGMSAADLARVDRLSRMLDWFYNVPALRSAVTEAARMDPAFAAEFAEHVAVVVGAGACPGIEDRLGILARFLKSRGSPLYPGLVYLWFRSGFSARHGLAPAVPWKKPIPEGATLVEGDAALPVARIWRVEIDRTYFFCYGTGPSGARAVVAVFEERQKAKGSMQK